MGFRIKGDETVAHAFRRLARKQTRHALDALLEQQPSTGERVHEMRTSIKRVRALIDIARPCARRQAERVEQDLRKVARAAGSLRDGDVSLATFDDLLPALEGDAHVVAFRRLRGQLAARLRSAAISFEEEDGVQALARKLRRVRRRTKRWVPRQRGWRLLREGLCDGYRRARRAGKRAYASNTGVAFHAWRRAVKAHRYQLQLVEELWPGEATAHVEALERLGQLLGQEHDLTVLAETILSDRAFLPGEGDRARFLAVVQQRQQSLRAQARPFGERLFAERPGAFRRRIRDELGRDPKHDGDRSSAAEPNAA